MSRWCEVLREVRRKSIHVIPGFMAIPVVVWGGKLVAVPIATAFFILYLLHDVTLHYGLKLKVPIAYQTFRLMAREEEIRGRHFRGATYFWGVTLVLVSTLPPHIAAAAVMVSALGDAAAAIVGKALPNPKLVFNKRKSVSGSLAMLLTSTASCLVVGIPLVTSVITSVASTITESLTRKSVNDELTVPLVAALTLITLNYLGMWF